MADMISETGHGKSADEVVENLRSVLGGDDPEKQQSANDVMAGTIAVKQATKHYIDNSPEARQARALKARKEAENQLGESTGLRDTNKVVKTNTRGASGK